MEIAIIFGDYAERLTRDEWPFIRTDKALKRRQTENTCLRGITF